MKRQTLIHKIIFVFIGLIVLAINSKAQSTTVQKHKIAIFAPLYLDSAFARGEEYRYTKNTLPRFFNPGLEFYEGVQLALDSLNQTGANLEVFIYDTRSSKETLDQQLNRPEIKDVNLIIAHCSNNELRLFASVAANRHIPFINTTIPNDAGITGNPNFVILNPTLRTQCEGIYKFIQKNYSLNPIVVFRRKGSADDMVKNLFDDYSKYALGTPIKLKYVTLADSFSVKELIPHLDSVRHTLCVAGSLDVNFGKRLAFQLASVNQAYKSVVMGMPTWDAVKDFSKLEYKGIEIVFSTPFYNAKSDKVSANIKEYFNNELYARPSDMAFRGYEATWIFSKLLSKYGKDISSNLTNKEYHLFTDYDIQPVINRSTNTLDYFENKKLYFLKWWNGTYKVVN